MTPQPPKSSSSRTFFWIALPIIVFIAVSFTIKIDPAEDAHIMFRYATNLAHGHGLVWNIGEAPVEGATELLWTLFLAAGVLAGFELGSFAQILALIFAALTIIMMYVAMTKLFFIRRSFASAASCVFAASPVVVQSLSGFGTALFTFFLTSGWIGLVMYNGSSARGKYGRWLLPISLLLLCLTRPEGVFFSILVFLASFFLSHRDDRSKLIRHFFWLFIMPGLLYFIWRWQYFGWLLPNTFYAKHGGEFIHASGLTPINRLFWISLPIFALILIHLTRIASAERKKISFFILPALCFPWFYLLIEQMQNIGLRFQFPVFPVYLILGAWIFEAQFSDEMHFDKNELLKFVAVVYVVGLLVLIAPMLGGSLFTLGPLRSSAVVSVFLFVVLGYRNLFPSAAQRIRYNARKLLVYTCYVCMTIDLFGITSTNTSIRYDHRVQMGKALKEYSSKKYAMVTTEAGWLPYFSEWKAVDPFGLYDAHVAHHGLDEKYLDLISPELIIFHVYSDAYTSEWVHNDPKWNEMTRKLYTYAISHRYTLAARVGVHHDCFWYFVKNSSADADALVRVIARQEGVQYTRPVE